METTQISLHGDYYATIESCFHLIRLGGLTHANMTKTVLGSVENQVPL